MTLEHLAQFLGMFVAVIGGVWVLTRALSKKAYENGVHSQEHTDIREDVQAAHSMIRENRVSIAALEATGERNAAEHEAIRAGQEKTNDTLDRIMDILMEGKR